jgi:hypothetical protein
MPWWPIGAAWLCIGTGTATVLTVLLDRYMRARGDTWDRTQKLNMAILDVTIMFAWIGFYGVLILWQFPRTRRVIIQWVQTGKPW